MEKIYVIMRDYEDIEIVGFTTVEEASNFILDYESDGYWLTTIIKGVEMQAVVKTVSKTYDIVKKE